MTAEFMNNYNQNSNSNLYYFVAINLCLGIQNTFSRNLVSFPLFIECKLNLKISHINVQIEYGIFVKTP